MFSALFVSCFATMMVFCAVFFKLNTYVQYRKTWIVAKPKVLKPQVLFIYHKFHWFIFYSAPWHCSGGDTVVFFRKISK